MLGRNIYIRFSNYKQNAKILTCLWKLTKEQFQKRGILSIFEQTDPSCGCQSTSSPSHTYPYTMGLWAKWKGNSRGRYAWVRKYSSDSPTRMWLQPLPNGWPLTSQTSLPRREQSFTRGQLIILDHVYHGRGVVHSTISCWHLPCPKYCVNHHLRTYKTP